MRILIYCNWVQGWIFRGSLAIDVFCFSYKKKSLVIWATTIKTKSKLEVLLDALWVFLWLSGSVFCCYKSSYIGWCCKFQGKEKNQTHCWKFLCSGFILEQTNPIMFPLKRGNPRRPNFCSLPSCVLNQLRFRQKICSSSPNFTEPAWRELS